MSSSPYYIRAAHRPFTKVYRDQQGEPADTDQKVVLELRWREIKQWMSRPEPGIPRQCTRREEISSGYNSVTNELHSFLVPRTLQDAVGTLLSGATPLAQLLSPGWAYPLRNPVSKHIFDALKAEADDTEFAEIKFVLDIKFVKEFVESEETVETEPEPEPENKRNGSEAKEVEDCVICLKELNHMGKPVKNLPCFHRFHQLCIDTWLRRADTCPTCRRDAS